jgi:hypothetical protein
MNLFTTHWVYVFMSEFSFVPVPFSKKIIHISLNTLFIHITWLIGLSTSFLFLFFEYIVDVHQPETTILMACLQGSVNAVI